MNWRDAASPQTQSDLDSLLDNSIEAAADVLGRDETILPFCLAIGVDGDRMMRRLDRSSASSDEATTVERLTFADDHDALRARAVVLDVRITRPTASDALKIVSEHRDGFSMVALVPYINRDDVFLIDTDSMTVAQGPPRLWGSRATISDP